MQARLPRENPAQHEPTCLELPDEQATQRLARALAMHVQGGSWIFLDGDLGTGKSTLAREFIRTLACDPALEVPSPSFSLVQTYEAGCFDIAHVDLYRLAQPGELAELGLDDLPDRAIVLVEWPQNAAELLPQPALSIELSHDDDVRRARLVPGDGFWTGQLPRLVEVETFLARAGWHNARRMRLPGDASSRRYERLLGGPDGGTALLMDMPARPDGPPDGTGRTYSAIAHLAEGIEAVLAVNHGLLERGLSAPRTFAHDTAAGLAIVEDFGTDSFNAIITRREDFSQALLAAVMLLSDMAGQDWPCVVELPDGTRYKIPEYDMDAMLAEVELFLDWYWPRFCGCAPSDAHREEFLELWRATLSALPADDGVWVLRDFHADNLFWLPERSGNAVVGLIDTQDCVRGHPAYDLASLLQDVRITIPQSVARDYLDLYHAAREDAGPDYDRSAFEAAYCVLGAQRATKILGIFSRLDARDGKPQYLRHLPRTWDVLELNLRHAMLAPLAAFLDLHVAPSTRREAVR